MNSQTEEIPEVFIQPRHENGETSVNELSKRLDINADGKQYDEKNWLRKIGAYESYKPIRLTEKGKKKQH